MDVEPTLLLIDLYVCDKNYADMREERRQPVEMFCIRALYIGLTNKPHIRNRPRMLFFGVSTSVDSSLSTLLNKWNLHGKVHPVYESLRSSIHKYGLMKR